MRTKFLYEGLRGKYYLEDPSKDGSIMDVKEIRSEVMDWI